MLVCFCLISFFIWYVFVVALMYLTRTPLQTRTLLSWLWILEAKKSQSVTDGSLFSNWYIHSKENRVNKTLDILYHFPAHEAFNQESCRPSFVSAKIFTQLVGNQTFRFYSDTGTSNWLLRVYRIQIQSFDCFRWCRTTREMYSWPRLAAFARFLSRPCSI